MRLKIDEWDVVAFMFIVGTLTTSVVSGWLVVEFLRWLVP